MIAPFFIRRSVLLLVLIALPRAPHRAAGQAAQSPKVEIVCPIDADTHQPLAMGRAVLGAFACKSCHSQGTGEKRPDADSASLVSPALLAEQVNDNWVRGDEWATWSGDFPIRSDDDRYGDRHAQAYTTLLGKRSQAIGKSMGIAEVQHDARCLACHSTLPAASVKRDGNVVDASYFPAGRAGAPVYLGVSCEACHGAAGKVGADGAADARAGWIDRHIAKQEWRYKAPEEKQEGFGYYDVRSPSSRAAMCLSCHLGDASQGRLVTHEMYAAGHPPLPSFELKAFVDMMPAHWRDMGSSATAEAMETPLESLLGKKPQALTAEFLSNTADPYYRQLREQHPEYFAKIVEDYEEHFAGARSMAVGVLTAWVKNAELAQALMSQREYPLLPRDARWPELSQFECSACHHELRQADWRQDANVGAPGRPVFRDWAAPLSRAVLVGLAPNAAVEFERRRREIELAVAAQPYGDRALVDKLLGEAAVWLAGVVREIEARPFGRTEAVAVVRAIAAAGAERPLDYDSARQMTWALSKTLDEIDPSRQWSAVRQPFQSLEERFVLDLATTKVRQGLASIAGDSRADEIDLGKVLPAAANHSGREVREAFAKVAAAIQTDPP